MHIGLMTTEYPPFFGGGIGTYARHMVEQWLADGHAVTVLLYDPRLGERADVVEETTGRLRLVRFGEGPKPDPPVPGLAYAAAVSFRFAEVLADLVRRGDAPDVVESQEYDAIAYFVLQRKHTHDPAFRELPVVLTAHGPKFIWDRYEDGPLYKLPHFWTGEMERFCLAAADAVVSPSAYLRDLIRAERPDLAVHVVRNPFRPAPDPAPAGSGRGIYYVGRIQRLKGVLELAAAFDRLWTEGFPDPLHLVGGDTAYRPLERSMTEYLQRKYARWADQDRLRFLGPRPPDALRRLLADARLVVVPSLIENFPYVVLEAMGEQRVVLASDRGGQREIIRSGENGFLFAHEGPEALAARIREALAADGRALGEAARATVLSATDPARVAAEKLELFETVVAGRRRPRRLFPVARAGWNRARPPAPAPPRRLSVIIPYFNLGELVRETVESVLQASEPPEEIILVNDGSTDSRSLAFTYRLEAEYPTLRVVRQPNRGLSEARNQGARAARAPYLAFVDADDRVHPDLFRTALDLLEAYDNLGFVGCWVQYFEGDDSIWMAWNPEPPYILYHNTVLSGGIVVRRDVFLEAGLNDPGMTFGMEDWDSIIQMVGNGVGGAIIPRPLYYYRVRRDSMSRAFNRTNREFLYQRIVAKHKDLVAAHAEALAGLLNQNGPQWGVDGPTEV
ncbi:MAG: glycosyltransferase [Actinomycetia bacterium]|nr:glycosyltransferase [Actinomycetes bacterium]